MDTELEEFCHRYNVYLNMLNTLTTKVRGFCYYIDGEYLVFINSCLCSDSQKRTLLHEFEHIFENHFSCDPSDREKCEDEVKTMMNDIDALKKKYNCEAAVI